MGGGGGDMPAPTAYEKELAKMAMKELQVYEEKMVPFRDQFIADVTRPTAVAEDRVAGEVNADFAQAGKGAIRDDPSLGVNRSAIPTQKAGRTQAFAAVAGTQEARDTRVKGMQAGLDLIQKGATDAELGMANLAGRSTSEAISKKENQIARQDAVVGAISSTAGAGAAIYKNSSSGLKPYTDAQGGTYKQNSSDVRVKPIYP